MTAPKQPSKPWIKPALEFGPVLGFFVAYLLLKDDTFLINGREYGGMVVVTAGFVPVLLVATGLLWRLTGRLAPMQIMTAVLVLVFGGLTVWLNDPSFIKMKPTILYACFAALLGVGLLRGESWLKSVLGEALPMEDAGWMILTKRFFALFVVFAVSNELIWRLCSEQVWVYAKTFGFTVAMVGFMIAQKDVLERYMIEDEGPDA